MATVVPALVAGLLVDRWAVSRVDRGGPLVRAGRPATPPSSPTSSRARSGSGVEELVFVGWLTPLLALAGLVAIRKRRGLARSSRSRRARALPARARLEPPRVRDRLAGRSRARLDPCPGAVHADRVPGARRTCGVRVERATALVTRGFRLSPSQSARRWSSCSRSTCGCRCSAPSPRTAERGVRGDPRRRSAARAARVPARPPLRQRLPRLRPPEPA